MNDLDGKVLGRRHAFFALCLARFREAYRESEVVFWSFVFPVVLAVGLGLAFRNRGEEVLVVAVTEAGESATLAERLSKGPGLKVRVLSSIEAARELRAGKVALVAESTAGGVTYRLDLTRPESRLARDRANDVLQRAAGRRDVIVTRVEEVREPGGRYIDFLIPGILGLNLMGGGMWGVGFNLVDMRIKKLLKRLLATPMSRSDFMLSHLSMRLASMVAEVLFLLLFGHFAFGVPFRGSWVAIFVVGGLGALSFGGMGLLTASRARRIETVIGLTNVITLPMYVASGVFFSVSRFPEPLQAVIRVLPLTALIDALRAVVLEGAGLASQLVPLAILGGWGAASFVLGLRFFRWS